MHDIYRHVILFDWKKEKVMLIRREANIFTTQWIKQLEHKKTHEKYLVFDKQRHILKDGIEPFLYRVKTRYYKLYFLENGRLIKPNSSMVESWNPLLNEQDILSIKERSALSELLKPKLEKPDLVFTILAIALGLMAGLLLGYFVLGHISTTSGTTVTQVFHTASSSG